ncbi:protein NUCLEOLAR COMPLEX ASSOCIATED 4 isoform X2 [Hevea brasiliensis]|uniref:protein NUCLEOLAR COMPLEX ASSOCIATED 4 isoform X2 n=1 Tax=Hevea brasiliensis TaxID=3981 RepID=UPI000B78BD80|nr:protein NUCLEOLAR COMPLEX ASSOCIATED 4 isoform X2 [Hevea brasiliensis]
MASEKKKSKAKHTLKEVKTLGQQLLSSRTYVNNLPLLLTFVSPNFPPQYVLESLLSLQSFFTTLLPSLSSYSLKNTKKTSEEDDAELIYRTWLRSKFDDLVRLLIDLLFSEQADEALRQFVLDSLMEFVKVGNGGRFHSALYHRLLHTILHSSTPVDLVLDLLLSKYFKYIDVRYVQVIVGHFDGNCYGFQCYFTHISLAKLAKTLESKDNPDDKTKTADGDDESHSRASMDLCIHKIHYIMSHVPPLEVAKENSDYEMWSGSEFLSKKGETEAQNNNNGLSAANISKKMKLKFTKAWISFLRLPLPVDIYKEVLISLHQAVIPYISNPIMLCDFLTRSYDIGGVVSVMALSSLFILMTQHGLEYPNFYEKLYALLLPSVFMAKHRAKFFQLLDTCLKSTLLPAYLAAAFTKKLSRLSLSVPPSGAVVIIALIHNLLRRHPSINCLVHRENDNENAADNSDVKGENARNANDSRTGSGTSAENLCVDHFNNEESNPAKSNALKSSLWEIDTLRHHYCPPVSRFVDSLKNDLTIRDKTTEVNIKDFSSSSYSTIFGEELRRRVKQVPLAFYKATPSLLFSDDFTGWTFKYEESKGSKSEENGCSPAKRQRM